MGMNLRIKFQSTSIRFQISRVTVSALHGDSKFADRAVELQASLSISKRRKTASQHKIRIGKTS